MKMNVKTNTIKKVAICNLAAGLLLLNLTGCGSSKSATSSSNTSTADNAAVTGDAAAETSAPGNTTDGVSAQTEAPAQDASTTDIANNDASVADTTDSDASAADTADSDTSQPVKLAKNDEELLEMVQQKRAEETVDLTTMSSTMVYSEVFAMMNDPEQYMGKTVRMQGSFAIYEDQTNNENYYACLIQDATACCAQGIEFVWDGEHSYPEDYPELGSEIRVEGIFSTYDLGGVTYCTLQNASLVSL